MAALSATVLPYNILLCTIILRIYVYHRICLPAYDVSVLCVFVSRVYTRTTIIILRRGCSSPQSIIGRPFTRVRVLPVSFFVAFLFKCYLARKYRGTPLNYFAVNQSVLSPNGHLMVYPGLVQNNCS